MIETNLPNALKLKEEGNVLVKEKRYKEALEKYEEAIQIEPLLAQAWLNKGMMHVNLQQYPDALLAFVNVGLNPRKDGEGLALQPIPLSRAITTKIVSSWGHSQEPP